MLNKITGCDSRTVPPLYVLVPVSTGESRSLGEDPGKAEIGGPQSQGTSQKTYEVDSPTVCVLWAVCFVAEKRLRRLILDAAAYLIFWRFL